MLYVLDTADLEAIKHYNEFYPIVWWKISTAWKD